MIVERLNSVGLRIEPASYNVGNTRLKLLGHVLSESGVALDPEKLEMIAQWPQPTTGASLASALGLGAYMRDHVRNYAEITAPLEAVKKQKEITWTPLLTSHWELFKRAFGSAPILSFPDFNKRFVIACDASQTGIGGVLYQPDDEKNEITAHNIIAICSKVLNATQRNYPVYKKELWGMVYSLRKFHSVIWGRKDVIVLTDHRPLIHVLQQKQLSVSLQQWLDVLLDYNLSIQYRPGVMHVVPDALSRMFASTHGADGPVWGQHSFITLLKAATSVSSPSDDLCQQSIDAIRPTAAAKRHATVAHMRSGGGRPTRRHQHTTQNEAFDDECMREIAEAPSSLPFFAASDTSLARIATLVAERDPISNDERQAAEAPAKLTIEERLALAQLRRGKQAPDSDEQKQSLLDKAHALGHFGERAMSHHINREGYWWPQMYADIATTVSKCSSCRQYNAYRHGYQPSRSIRALLPGDHYQIDLAEFPESSDGRKFCLVLIDVFTGFIVLRALKNKRADTVAETLWNIFTTIGPPKVLQSDNGTEFLNATLTALNQKIGVLKYIGILNIAHRGQTNRHGTMVLGF